MKKVYLLITALVSTQSLWAVDLEHLESFYGKGEISVYKDTKVSFFFNKDSNRYEAKVKFRVDKLHINESSSDGLIQIPFNQYQKLEINSARYYKLDSSYEKTLVENVKVRHVDERDYFINNIFYSDLKVKQFKSTVSLPKTYFVSYSYTLTYYDLRFLTSFFFQESGEAVHKVKVSIKNHSDIDLRIDEYNLNNKFQIHSESYQTVYKSDSLKRFSDSKYNVSASHYLPHIILSVKSYKIKKTEYLLLKTTKDLYYWYNTLIKQLKPNQNIVSQLTKAITSTAETEEEKLKAIFSWVQNNIQYVAFEDGLAGFKPAEAHEVIKLKYGDCKGMANLLVCLLREAGFDARHAWIGTRSKNYSYSQPSLAVDNHMICGLKWQDKWYYLDATAKSASIEQPPHHIEGKEVLVGIGENFQVNKIPVSLSKNNQIVFKSSLELKNNIPNISILVHLKGHFAKDFISRLKYSSKVAQNDIPIDAIKPFLKGIKVESVSNLTINESEISYRLKGKFLNHVHTDGKMLLFPFIDFIQYGPMTRNSIPIYIKYPYLIINTATIKSSDAILYNQKKQIDSEFGFGLFSVEKNGDLLKVRQMLQINRQYIQSREFKKWNQFINSYRNYQSAIIQINKS